MKKLLEGLQVECLAATDYDKTGLVADVWLKPVVLRKAVKRLYEAGYLLEDLSALDTTDGILVVYHFDHMQKSGRVAFRVLLDGSAPKVSSIADIFQGARWHEREVRDFHAVDFDGHPNLIPLLLPADMEPGVLLKSDKTRKAVIDIMALGETESCSAAVEALFTKSEEEAPAEG